jgi:hypothetical protein
MLDALSDFFLSAAANTAGVAKAKGVVSDAARVAELRKKLASLTQTLKVHNKTCKHSSNFFLFWKCLLFSCPQPGDLAPKTRVL